MRLSTVWAAYRAARDLIEFHSLRADHYVQLDGRYARKMYRLASAEIAKRGRQCDKLAARITDELDAIESARPWTYIDEGLPTEGEAVEAAWVNNRDGRRTVAESWIDPMHDDVAWESSDLPHTVISNLFDWRVYAWRPRRDVEAPPIKESE